MFSLGNAKTKTQHLKILKISYQNMPKIAFSWFLPFCGNASQVEHAREHNRIYTENKFWKRDTDWQNGLAMRFYMLV